MAPGRQIRRAAHDLRQQDGQDRRRFLHIGADGQGPPWRQSDHSPASARVESRFRGIIDLIRMKAVVWDDESLGAKFHDEEIPADLLDQAKQYRGMLVEQAVEVDEAATEAYLEGKEPCEAELKALIRKGTVTSQFVPILCGSAFKNKGVQPLLDAVVDYLPSPLDVPPVQGIDVKTGESTTREPKDDAPLSMLAFKIMNDPFVGSLTFCRIYSGKVD